MEKLSILFVFGIFIAVGSTMTLVLIPEGESVYAQNGTLIGNTTAQNQTLTTQNDTLAPFGLEKARQGEAIGQQEAAMGEQIGKDYANEWK